jgi:membrane-bound ClpP family serine protease
MKHQGPKNPARSFGVSVGIVLCLIAAVLWWRGRVGRAEILVGVGGFLLVAGLTYPRLLKYPSALWWKFAMALGYVNARVLLTILFAIVLVWRLTGKDPLARRRDQWKGWTPYPARYRDPKHYERMY